MAVGEPIGHGKVVLEAFSVPYDALHSENALEAAEEEGKVTKGAKFLTFLSSFIFCFPSSLIFL